MKMESPKKNMLLSEGFESELYLTLMDMDSPNRCGVASTWACYKRSLRLRYKIEENIPRSVVVTSSES